MFIIDSGPCLGLPEGFGADCHHDHLQSSAPGQARGKGVTLVLDQIPGSSHREVCRCVHGVHAHVAVGMQLSLQIYSSTG